MTRRRRRRYVAPDGCDWRNPRMPVFARWRGKGGKIEEGYLDPSVLEMVCRHGMNAPGFPDWRHDPTYQMRRRRSKPGQM